jgi:radical SAM protein with 4Fe4S-binding SPASM domain
MDKEKIDKKDLYKNHCFNKFNLVIIPTYRCNASCSFCYAKNLEKQFPEDMSFWKFVEIMDCFIEAGGRGLTIAGGEPMLWEHVNKAIIYAKTRGVKVQLLTNAINRSWALPDQVYINIHPWIYGRKEKIDSNINYFIKKGVGITLRYNFEVGVDKTREVSAVVDLLTSHKIQNIHLAPAVPYKLELKTGEEIFSVLYMFHEAGFKVSSVNPLPPCLFSGEEIKTMKDEFSFYSKCNIGSAMIVNPDGKTVMPCLKLPNFKEVDEIDFKSSKSIFKVELESIAASVPEKCHDCDYFMRKECLGGCFKNYYSEILI